MKTEVDEATKRYFAKYMEHMEELKQDCQHSTKPKKARAIVEKAMQYIRDMRQVGILTKEDAANGFEWVEGWNPWNENEGGCG